MKINHFRHDNVNPEGTFSDRKGAVETKPFIRFSYENTFFLSISSGRDQFGTVRGMEIDFDSNEELEAFKTLITTGDGTLLY
jgi:hypothetical protein